MGQMDANQCSIKIVGRWVGVRNIPGLVVSKAVDGLEFAVALYDAVFSATKVLIPCRNTLESKKGSMLESVSTLHKLKTFCGVQSASLLLSSTCSIEDMEVEGPFKFCSAVPMDGDLPARSYFFDQRSSFWNPGH